MKPLFRWTIGPVETLGFEILEHSVNIFKRINKEFDLLICHNNLEKHQLERIKKLDVPLFCQDGVKTNLIWTPSGVGNKLYPPRLRFNTHEVIMDNDIVLIKNNFLIDFLNNNYCFATETPQRNFGNFDKFVPENLKINSGIIGLPPMFDFESKIQFLQKTIGNNKFEDYFDEQGMVATIISNQKNYKILSKRKIIFLANLQNNETEGIHFVKANSGYDQEWMIYRKNKKMFI